MSAEASGYHSEACATRPFGPCRCDPCSRCGEQTGASVIHDCPASNLDAFTGVGLSFDRIRTASEARAFASSHVLISKRDLVRIKDFARKLGALAKLKALNIKVHDLEPRL